MAVKKSEIVKANIDLKKGTLQLEGPQEFVEKFLNPIIKKSKPFSKAFPKPKPKAIQESQMEEKNQIGQHKTSVLKTLVRLSIGIFTLSLIDISKVLHGTEWVPTFLIIFGALLVLSVISLVIPHPGQEWSLKKIFTKQTTFIFDSFSLFITLALFSVLLIDKAPKTGITWLALVGVLIMLASFPVLYYNLWQSSKIKD